MCSARMITSAPAKLVSQVSCANGRMPACLIPVQMEAPVPPWPTSSPANACQASQGRNVRLTSMSVTFLDNASMVAPASTSRAPISANAPRASPASTATAPTCHVHPRPVSMEALAGRPATSLLSATAFQVLKAAPVSRILMTAPTTGVRTEGFVWMGSIPTTAAAPLSGQDSSARRMWTSACCSPTPVRMEAPVPTAMEATAACASMAGVEMTAVRTSTTVPSPPARRAPPALTAWPPSHACAPRERQDSYVIWMMHASAIRATRGHCVIPTP